MTRSAFIRWLGGVLLAILIRPVHALANRAFQKVPIRDVNPAEDMAPRVVTPPGETTYITPVNRFYVEDISGPPEILPANAADWQLSLTGKVARPLTFTYPQLLEKPSVRQTVTLSCIGNPVGGFALGNAEWQGIPLKDLLREAEPEFFSNTLILRGADGYHDSIPLRRARHPGTLLATHMNGRPLTRDHGFPLRLMVPGLYGIKQVKWLQAIVVSNQPHEGYWQKRNWTRDARVKVMSRIDFPQNEDWLERRRCRLRGVAFAGDRGIQYVQVSLDGERTWQLADLAPTRSPYSWALWTFDATFPGPGRYSIAVRAVDQYSGRQNDASRDPFPSGTSGIHRIQVKVL